MFKKFSVFFSLIFTVFIDHSFAGICQTYNYVHICNPHQLICYYGGTHTDTITGPKITPCVVESGPEVPTCPTSCNASSASGSSATDSGSSVVALGTGGSNSGLNIVVSGLSGSFDVTGDSLPIGTSNPIQITNDTFPINGYNVCGDGRISVNPDNTVYQSTKTNSSKTPFYKSKTNSHCVCSFQPYQIPSPEVHLIDEPIPQTLPPDTFSKISSQNNSNKIDYSPVAIAYNSNEGAVDGRNGTLYKNNVGSQCGCPNLNEKLEALIPDFLSKPQGAYCKSALNGDHQVLMTYNPSVHLAQVINSESEPKDSALKIVTKIALPVSVGGVKTLPYTRRIWACSTGYVVDLSTKTCIFKPLDHQCSAGTNDNTASPVSSGVSGSSLSAKFDHTINKKLACCLNAYTKGNQNLKFDCIDNSTTVETSFDSLWASKDDDSASGDGGQLNAVVLSDSKGKPISGFYTLDGSRCNGFSEFGGELKPRTVNPTRSVTGQIETVDATGAGSASTLLLPSGDAYNLIHGKIGFNKVPVSPEELNRCPILVRAAMKVTCGANEAIPAVQTTITESGKKRCTAASKISIHVQVMQLTKIAGMAPMKTFDTVADPKSAATINIGKIVGSKNSGECADGAKRVGSQCVYQ